SSRRRHTRFSRDWSSDVCSSDLDLPLYSQDYDEDFPPAARAFKQAISDVDAILFVTPEYNRSIPGGLKNAIDWATRPWGRNSFTRKPSAVIGTSPGSIGTALAQAQLRNVLCFCNSPLLNTVEAYSQFKPGLISDDGTVSDEKTEQFLRNYMKEFHTFIVRVLTVLPREPCSGLLACSALSRIAVHFLMELQDIVWPG